MERLLPETKSAHPWNDRSAGIDKPMSRFDIKTSLKVYNS
jgi:hypothetical protein